MIRRPFDTTFRRKSAMAGRARTSKTARPADPLANKIGAPGLADYLQKILTAQVYDVADETPLENAKGLSRRLGNQVFLKREDSQPVFSFKLRGAYNKLAHLTPAQLQRGVICASAGNHAQGVALGAHKLGSKAVVVMPVTTPKLKIDAVKALGGEVVLQGESYSDAYLHAIELERSRKLTFVHPFDDPDVIAGQGTIAMEILRQHQGPIDAVFVAIGGGGLISGVAAYIKALRPEIKVIGVQTNDSDAMVRSVKARAAQRRRTLLRRHRRQAGGRGDLPHHPGAGRQLHHRRHRRRLRRDQGRVPGHPQRARTRRRAGRGSDQAVRRDPQGQGRWWRSRAART
jgi:cysteine synthase